MKNVWQIQDSFSGAFAAILGDGSAVTWGDADLGGDSSAVLGQLKTVQQIQTSSRLFFGHSRPRIPWCLGSSAVEDHKPDVRKGLGQLLQGENVTARGFLCGVTFS